MLVIRSANHDIPVGLTASLATATGTARQLAQDLKENYTLLRTYANKVNSDTHDPICVSVYEFIDNEISTVIGNYHIDQGIRRKSRFNPDGEDIHLAIHTE